MKKEVINKLKNHLDQQGFDFDFNETAHCSFFDATSEIIEETGIEESSIIEEILDDFTDLLIKKDTVVYGCKITKYQVFYVNDRLEWAFREYLNEMAA